MQENKIFWAPYSVDNERFASHAEALGDRRGQIRESFGIPDEATTFLFCGKLMPKKHPLDLLAAYGRAERALKATGRTAHLLVVGDGELSSDCRRYARERGLSATFAGFLNQSEITRAYVASDCLTLPSDSGETWGLVVNEAMACGRPAIVSDRVGCHLDLVVPGETGGIFPCRDIGALSELLIAFARNPGKLREMGQRARGRVQEYSAGQVADACTEALRSVTALPAAQQQCASGIQPPRIL